MSLLRPPGHPHGLVPKPDRMLQFCVDYRVLNSITVRDTYPIPCMDEYIDSLGSAKIFCTLDCNSAYWQIPSAEKDRDRTAFVCHSGLYRFRRMLFWLNNAPATFKRTLDILMSIQMEDMCRIFGRHHHFFDDIEDHFGHVREMQSASFQ